MRRRLENSPFPVDLDEFMGCLTSYSCTTGCGCTAVAFSKRSSCSALCDDLASSQLQFSTLFCGFVFEGFDVCKQIYFLTCFFSGQRVIIFIFII